MTRQAAFILGHRAYDDEDGVFVGLPGFDAATASQDEMSLYITTKIPQIAKNGVVGGPFPYIIPHAIGFAPIVLINLVSSDLVSNTTGYVRPFDMNTLNPTLSQVKSEAVALTFLQSGPARSINYFAYTIPAP